jgi:methylmalonyl-CoA mutase N-terminal domain/subunit
VQQALERLGEAAAEGENVLPACIEAVKTYATVGEIVGAIRAVHGAWREAVAR